MTKEYAIQILREMIPKFARCDTDVKRLTAINMAIKALSEERNNRDMVSRNDVISICNILADKMDDEGKVAVEQVRDAVKDMRPYEGAEE